MEGERATALEYAKLLEDKIQDAFAEQVGWAQAIKTAPYYAHAQLSEPKTILALPDPGNRFPLVQAMWHYARGVAFAAKGEVDQSRVEAAKIAALNEKTDFSYLLAWAVPAPDLLSLARHVIEGRIAQAQGDMAGAIKEFQIAVDIQASLSYMEPPYWYYPVHQSLGAALLEAGRAEDAERMFAKSLEQFPKSGWSLYGLMKAQQAQGKTDAAKATEQRFKQAWTGALQVPDLKRL
jgi:tetratricopeptide (TPR) repeat protein